MVSLLKSIHTYRNPATLDFDSLKTIYQRWVAAVPLHSPTPLNSYLDLREGMGSPEFCFVPPYFTPHLKEPSLYVAFICCDLVEETILSKVINQMFTDYNED